MATRLLSHRHLAVFVIAASYSLVTASQTRSQTSSTTGTVTQGTVTGGSATGGSATGGSATGGSATGGSATGGTATNVSGGGRVTSGTVTPGTATVNVGDREISASAEGSVSVQTESSKAKVHLDSHVLTVEPERLLLDGKEVGKLPATATNVKINLAGGRLTVLADGVRVLSEEIPSK